MSSLSRAEVAAMDQDELVETVVELSERVDDVENQPSLDGIEMAAVRKLLNGLAGVSGEGADPTQMNAVDTAQAAIERVDDLLNRIEQLEAENDRLRSRVDGTDSSGKDQKVQDIVSFANNTRGNDPAVKLTAKDIKGATGCSTRYAYDLMDDLPEEYDWMLSPQDMLQYGSLEIDNHDERRLGVDFEGVHSSGCPLNKFNNGNSGEGG